MPAFLPTRCATLAALVLLAVPAGAQEQGTYRTFRDWMAACDNTRACRAYALSESSDSDGVALGLDRAAGAEATPELFLHFRDEELVTNDRKVTIRSETGDIATLTVGQGLRAEDNIYRITDRQAVAAILAEMRRSKEMRLILDPAPDRVDAGGIRISLDGASAAFLWIDDRQKRVGTVTALVRPGERPASAVPRPVVPAAPAGRPATGGAAPATLPPATLAAVMAAYRRIPGDDCNQDDPDRDEPSIDRLAPRLLLVGIRCWRGAYNFSRAYYLIDEGPRPNVRPAAFPRPYLQQEPREARTPPVDHILWNADFSTSTGTIAHFSKGRGIGDCGETGEWAWNGRAFQAMSIRLMPTCRGIRAGDWFTLYRTR
jgi:hypothetical protein